MIRLAPAIVLLSHLGCGGLSMRPTRRFGIAENPAVRSTREECAAIDGRVVGLTATNIVASILGGGGGVASLLVDTPTPRYAVGGITLALAALAGSTGYFATFFARRYADQCTVNTGGK